MQDGSGNCIFNTQNDSMDRLLTALNCLDQKGGLLFVAIPGRFQLTIYKYFAQIECAPPRIIQTIVYHISKEDALNFNIEPPEGITISSVRLEHVDTINSLWPYHYAGSEKYVSRLITYNPSVGLFDGDGNLLAWCLIIPVGALGLLQVQNGQKRKGYGNLVVRVIAKKLAEMGVEITAPVVVENVPSRAMFEKLGFRNIDIAFWVSVPAMH